MKGSLTILMIVAVIVLVIVLLVIYVIKKVEHLSTSLFGVKSLSEGLTMQAEELAETPKSVAGMTRIYEPQLVKDFPEFNWKEFRDKAERMLLMAFAAISKGEETFVGGSAEGLREQVIAVIQENKRQQIKEYYKDIQIHRTEITRYEKKNGTCVLVLQSAVGHIHYKEKDGKLIEGNKERKEQTRYNIYLMYVQDVKKANMDKAVGTTCPSCGAPVSGLGEKKCEYCGSQVVPINIQVWSIQSFREVDYHKV